MADITIVNGVYKPTYNWGAPSCRVQRFLVLFVLLVAMQALENLGKFMPSKVMKLFTRALTLRFL